MMMTPFIGNDDIDEKKYFNFSFVFYFPYSLSSSSNYLLRRTSFVVFLPISIVSHLRKESTYVR